MGPYPHTDDDSDTEEPATTDATPGVAADETPALDALEPGDAFDLQVGRTLVVLAAVDMDGTRYDCEVRHSNGHVESVDYRPEHIRQALAEGAEYVGTRPTTAAEIEEADR